MVLLTALKGLLRGQEGVDTGESRGLTAEAGDGVRLL